jgi:hypothetical protein
MKKTSYLLLLSLLINIGTVNAQNEKYKAIFIYNFTKYIEWPASVKQDKFIIGVYGNSPIIKNLTNICKNKTAGSKQIEIKHYSSIDQISNCNILYITKSKRNKTTGVASKVNNQNTLIISDEHHISENGASINFVIKSGKQKFEISKKNIENKGLNVDPKLISLGIKI